MFCVPRICVLALAAAVLLSGRLLAQPASVKESTGTTLDDQIKQDNQKQQIATALTLTTEAAKRYEVKVGAAEGSLATQRPEPILRWSNPAVGEIHGNVFLWTLQERPVAVGSLFQWFSPHTHSSHEFHSLSELPLQAACEGRVVWQPKVGGVRFSAVDGAPRPATTVSQRLLQMRSLAKDFQVTKLERDSSQQELRLLPQPIYRYAAPSERVLDGGLFAFVQGTDPEVFLLLEARGLGKNTAWNFAVARMNSVGFQVRFRDREVWRADVMSWRDVGSHTETYTAFKHEAVPSIGK